jgi:hypothetical membrane protein
MTYLGTWRVNTKFLSPRVGAISGIVGSIAFAALWTAAAYQDGSWVLGKMTLSELGDRSRPGALLFNGGAVLAGLLSLVFSAGLYRVLSASALGRLGTATLAAASVCLIGVGLLPIDTGNPHTVVALSFFALSAAAMALLIVPAWRSHVLHRGGGLVTLVLLLISLFGLVTLELPAAEALSVGCLLLWTALIGVRVLWHHPVP